MFPCQPVWGTHGGGADRFRTGVVSVDSRVHSRSATTPNEQLAGPDGVAPSFMRLWRCAALNNSPLRVVGGRPTREPPRTRRALSYDPLCLYYQNTIQLSMCDWSQPGDLNSARLVHETCPVPTAALALDWETENRTFPDDVMRVDLGPPTLPAMFAAIRRDAPGGLPRTDCIRHGVDGLGQHDVLYSNMKL